jgi:hypothetical protein
VDKNVKANARICKFCQHGKKQRVRILKKKGKTEERFAKRKKMFAVFKFFSTRFFIKFPS